MKKLAFVSLLLIPTVVALALTAALASDEPEATHTKEYSFDLAVNVESDPGKHAGFIDMPGNIKLTATVVEKNGEATLAISGPDPWVTAHDDFDLFPLLPFGGFVFSATGTGTVADIENIGVEFTGNFDPEHPDGPTLTGFYSMGIQAEGANKLPGGLPIEYRIKAKPDGPVAPPPTALATEEAPTSEPPTPIPTEGEPQSQAGDINGDGTVNAIDASLVLQFNAGLLAVLPFPENGDVNRSDTTDAIDASLILQFVAGLIPGLPVGGPPPTSTPMPAPPTPTNTPLPQTTSTYTPAATATATPGTGKVSITVTGGPGRPLDVYQGTGCTGSVIASLTVSGSLSLSFSPGSYSIMAGDIKGWELVEGIEACQDVELTAGQKTDISFTYQQAA